MHAGAPGNTKGKSRDKLICALLGSQVAFLNFSYPQFWSIQSVWYRLIAPPFKNKLCYSYAVATRDRWRQLRQLFLG